MGGRDVFVKNFSDWYDRASLKFEARKQREAARHSCVPIRDRWRSCRGPAEKHPDHHKAMLAIDGCWSRELSPLVVQLLRQSALLRSAFARRCRFSCSHWLGILCPRPGCFANCRNPHQAMVLAFFEGCA